MQSVSDDTSASASGRLTPRGRDVRDGAGEGAFQHPDARPRSWCGRRIPTLAPSECKQFGNHLPDASAGTGHDGDLAGEFAHGSFPLVSSGHCRILTVQGASRASGVVSAMDCRPSLNGRGCGAAYSRNVAPAKIGDPLSGGPVGRRGTLRRPIGISPRLARPVQITNAGLHHSIPSTLKGSPDAKASNVRMPRVPAR